MKRRGRELFDLIADLSDPTESAEVRLTITAADFRTVGQEAIDRVTARAESDPDWHIAPDNREGIRISFDFDGKKESAWFLLRLSVHDPVLPLNLESDVKGGCLRMARELMGILGGIGGVDASNLKKYIDSAGA